MTKRTRQSIYQRVIHISGALTVMLSFSGCGHMNSNRAWGERAIYPVEWKRISQAAKNAAFDPITYVPLLGAGIIAAGNFDHRIADWSREETPVFGSTDTAKDFSDIGRNVLLGESFVTAMLTPSGDSAGEWALAKTKGVLVEAGGLGLTAFTTAELKDAFDRRLPDHSGNAAMPSGHASISFSGMALANRNLDYIDMNHYARTGLKVGNVALATSVAWARIEGGKHFPTDVLIGAALGNFLTRFVHDGFMNLEPEDRFSFYVAPAADGGKLFLSWDF